MNAPNCRLPDPANVWGSSKRLIPRLWNLWHWWACPQVGCTYWITELAARLSTPPMPEQVQFGIVGGGYWTERYLMVCRELPERFRISGLAVDDAEAKALAALCLVLINTSEFIYVE